MTSSVLFVCVGNLCRSPLAERLLRLRLGDRGVGGVDVRSAGVRAVAGHGMHPEAARTLTARGGDPTGFVARQVTAEMLDADLILAATRDLRSRLLEEAPRALRRTFTVTEFATLGPTVENARGIADLVERAAANRGAHRPETYDVPDPIGGDPELFDQVAVAVDAATTRIADALATAGTQ